MGINTVKGMFDKSKDTSALWHLFRERTSSLSKRQAISTAQGEMTFETLFKVAERLAAGLANAGVKEGNIVGLAVPNSLAFVPSFLALLKLSTTVALVSPKYRESELQTITQGLQPQCFLTVSSMAKVLEQKIAVNKRETIPLTESEDKLGLIFPLFPAASSTPAHFNSSFELLLKKNAALIKFTSGSTGVPKGIVVTADNVLAEAQNVTATLALTPGDRILAPVPIFHSYGFDLGVLAMLFSGATLILRDTFVPRRALADLSHRQVTIFLGVPSMYRIFVETPLSSVPDLSPIRYLLSCTAPLRPDLITAFYEKFRMPICQHYGSSETGAVTTHVPSQVLGRLESVGQPMKNVQLKIIDEKGEEMPTGEEGEVVVKSQVVAPGYIMGQPPGESKFRDDTYRTGDIGLVDEHDFLFLRGRTDDVINVGGFKVSPYEVAQVLESFTAVREAAAIGVKDANGEEVVYAVVTLKSPTTENEILAFCHSRLSDYKVPRRIDIRDEMPRGPSGKIELSAKDIRL